MDKFFKIFEIAFESVNKSDMYQSYYNVKSVVEIAMELNLRNYS